jgi:two-component system response regulator PilR (NtrC family)
VPVNKELANGERGTLNAEPGTRNPEPGTRNPERGTAAKLLVVDDERSMRELLSIVLRREGYDVTLADGGRSAIEQLERGRFDLLISDIKMPDMTGVDVLRAAKRIDSDILGIMITAFASADTAIEAMRLGAHDYLSKPFDVDELKMKVRNALEQRLLRQENVLLKRALGSTHQFANIVGRSDKMLAIFKLIEQIARTDSTVLVTGESGTGKEWVARAIHFYSLRRDRPFVALNCGALPETLLESELFGHMKGAFTGASANKKGLIEAAEKGTLFLDEIGEMTPMMQVKLLRVLQERKFRRLGGVEELEGAMRVIAATNQDLTKMVGEGRFREDLFYRINVIPIHLPPLREREEDIPLLAEYFLGKYRDQMGKDIHGLAQETMDLLDNYEWPGNIRELENIIQRAVILTNGPELRVPLRDLQAKPAAATEIEAERGTLRDVTRERILQALRDSGNIVSGPSGAAARLGVKRTTLQSMMRRLDIRRPSF